MSAIASVQLAATRAIQRSHAPARALADAEPWLVIPSLLLGFVAPRLLGPALVVAAGFWVVRWLAWGRLTVRTAGDWPVAVLMLLMPVTLAVTALPEVTLRQIAWLSSGVALYYAIVNWVRTMARERILVLSLVTIGFIAALIAPVAVTWVTAIKLEFIPESLYSQLPVLASVQIHPNVLAGALVLCLPVPLALLMFDAPPRMPRHERFAAVAAAAGIAVILVLTKSRGALLAAAAAATVLSLLRWRRAWIPIVLAGLLAGLAVWRTGPTQVIASLSESGSIVGVPGRLEIWSRGVYLAQDFPFTGIGMGTFNQVSNALYPYFLLGPDADVPHSHNLFLQVAVDLGIPGLVAWLALFFVVALSAWRVYRAGKRESCPWVTGLGAGLLGSQLALAIHGLVDAAVWGAHSGIVVWTLWGVTMASASLRNRTE